MRKKFLIATVLIVSVMCASMFVGCSDIKIGKAYNHYLYNGFDEKFYSTGNKLEYYDNFYYKEFLARPSTSEVIAPYELEGNFVYDKDVKTIYGEFFSQSFKDFKKSYKAELIAAGTSSYIADTICNSLINETSYIVSGNEMFKVASVQGSRQGSFDENLDTLEGLYAIKGLTGAGTNAVMFKRGVIYLPSNPDEADEANIKYDLKSGTYEVSGKFVTVRPDNVSSNKIPKQQKYLIATVSLPKLSSDMITGAGDDSYLAENGVIQAISNKKIKVLVLDFYSRTEFK